MGITRWFSTLLIAAAVSGVGCGINDDDFQAANRLLIVSITDASGSSTPIFPANEETDDFGEDGEPNTGDNGEDNGRPDQGEEILTPITNDRVTMEVANDPRPGVDQGVELSVYRIDVTYLDANGNSRSFAPTQNLGVAEIVAPDGSASIEFVLVPASMKTDGLREIFLFGTDEQKRAVQRWTAVVDVYARDQLNDDNVHNQARVAITFINPMTTE